MKKLPTKENYENFLNEFSNEVSLNFPDCCFFLYGSFTDGRCKYGLSDIDGGLILNTETVIPDYRISILAESLANALQNNRVETQFNLLERQTNKDGRFLSYTTDYTDWLKRFGKVSCGPDYLHEMNGLDFKSACLSASAFNLRRMRNLALYSCDKMENNPKEFRKDVFTCLKKAVSFPKKLVWLREENVIPSRNMSCKRLSEILDDVDLSFIEEINLLFDKPTELYETLDNSDIVLFGLMLDSLTSVEKMIKAYVKQFPEYSERELK